MKQFGHEAARRELADRNHGGVREGRVGLDAHLGQGFARDLVADEARQHLGGDVVVGLAGEGRDLFTAEGRPFLRHIEAAVRG